jgi:hypothetical protein
MDPSRGALYHHPRMKMTREELERRLAEAAEMRRVLRRATLEWQAVREQVLSRRRHGPERPDDRRPARG